MSMGYTFYYSALHGVGICVSEDYYPQAGTVLFEDGTEQAGELIDLVYLSRGGLRFGGSGENLFYSRGSGDRIALAAGEKLFESGAVQKADGEKEPAFSVKDSRKAVVRFSRRSSSYLEMQCSCGERHCRHEAAVCRYLSEHITLLKQSYLKRKDLNHSLFLMPELEQKLDAFQAANHDGRKPAEEEAREILRLIREVGTAGYVGGVLDYLFSMADDWGYDARLLAPYMPLFTAMALDPVIGPMAVDKETCEKYLNGYQDRQYKSNQVTFRTVLRDVARFEKERKKGVYTENETAVFALEYLEDYGGLLDYYASPGTEPEADDLPLLQKTAGVLNNAGRREKNCNGGEEEDPENTGSPVPAFPYAAAAGKILLKLEHFPAIEERNRTISMLLAFLPPAGAAEVLTGLKSYTLPLEAYRKLPPELQKKLMLSMGAEPETVRYIIGTVLNGEPDERKAAYVFAALEHCGRPSEVQKVREPFSELLDTLPSTGLLRLEAEYRYSGFAEKEDRNRWNPYINPRRFSAEEKEITLYYDAAWELQEQAEKVFVYHQFTPRGTGLGPQIFISEDQDGHLAAGALAGFLTEDSVRLLVGISRKRNGEQIDRAVTERREAILAKRFAADNRVFIRAYDELLTELNREPVIFTEAFRVTIRYLLTEEDGKLYLAFRVGNVKDYVVRNAFDFLSSFRKRETVEYGKDLILTHDAENLKPEDQPVIRMLTAMKFAVPKGDAKLKRFLPVKGAMLANLLEMLSGRRISFQNESCLLRLEETEMRVRIDADCRLSVVPGLEKRKLFVSDGKGYLFTEGENGWTVDRVAGTPEEISFLRFAAEHGGVSIRPILPDFRKQLYSRFFDRIDADPSLSQDLRLSEIRISAYFDYDEKKISCREELSRDGKTVFREEVRERIDLSKLDRFDGFLRRLGFEGGEIADEGRVLSFFKTDFSELKKVCSVYLSESLNRKQIVSVSRQNVRITCKGNLMEAVLEKSEFSEEELEKILQALRRKKKYILLSGDRLVDLDSEQAKSFAETVKDLGLEPGRLYRKKRLTMVNALKAFAHEKNCSIDRHLRRMIEEIRTYREADIREPALELPMRPYQQEGFRWMKILADYGLGGILADDMGLGKTIQVIALLAADKTEKPDLVVCPKSLVFNWIREFARFAPFLETEEIYGPAAQRSRQIGEVSYEKRKVYITSYDSLRNDISSYQGEFRYCVLDEAQYIKNSAAQKTHSVKEIRALHRFALTGTPIENTVEDLWSIFDFLMPGYFEDLPEFRTAAREENFTARVAAQIGPFVLRRVKENVLADLPAKYERILSTEMTDEQRALYDALRMKAGRLLEETGKAFDLLPYLMHLRQICVDPAMAVENYAGKSGKMELLEELIPQYLAEGHRILLFSQFVKGLGQVEKLLEKKKIPYFLLTGGTDAKKRAEMIREFNSSSGTDVFLISLKAGGTGLNLTGADTVIHLDPWWNTAAEDQASDRAHRIGQTRNVEVIRLIADHSIEQRVIELQNKKRDLIDRIISDDESSVVNASLEDIRFILQ